MAFRFELDETVQDGAQRIVSEQVDSLERLLGNPEELGLEESVHEARRRCKKLRALARLLRPSIGRSYGRVNGSLRDAARELSRARDAQVAVGTLESLTADLPSGIDAEAVEPVRCALLERERRESDALAHDDEAFGRARNLVGKAAAAAALWRLDDGFGSIAGGLERTYGRVVSGWHAASTDPTAAAFHEWRKRVKYHRYHVELLRPVDPRAAEVERDGLHRLSDLLGEEHDLSVLLGTVGSRPAGFGGQRAVRVAMLLGDARRSRLRHEAVVLGARLTTEDPEALTRRWEARWTTARLTGA